MVNKVILIGNLGKDPEVRLNGASKIASFTLATSERWKDRHGETQEQTEWHNVSVFGTSASFVEKYLHKGDRVYVEGKIHYSKVEDRYYTNIHCDSIKLVSGGRTDKTAVEEVDDKDLPF